MPGVVITAQAVASAIGVGVPAFQQGLFSGKSGTTGIRGRVVPKNFPVPHGALLPVEWNRASDDPSWEILRIITAELLRSLPEGIAIDGVVLGYGDSLPVYRILDLFPKIDSATNWLKETCLQALADTLLAERKISIPRASMVSIQNACASSNIAIGTAFQKIAAGRWTRALVGGVDARMDFQAIFTFYLLGALTVADVPSERASCPFSAKRAGFVKGEGGALLLLEDEGAANARGAKILGRVLGYANTTDAWGLTDPRPDSKGMSMAMEKAIAMAGIPKTAIDCISAHGTSTPLNDRLETNAIKQVFGSLASKIPITALKSQVGHTTVASGALKAVSALLMMAEEKISPTINFEAADPDCDLDYVPNVTRHKKVRYLLSNNFGFGGQNACLVLGAP